MSRAEQKIVAVHLVKKHRHAGRDYAPGTAERPVVLRLPEGKAEWLVAQGVAAMPPEPVEPRVPKGEKAAPKAPVG